MCFLTQKIASNIAFVRFNASKLIETPEICHVVIGWQFDRLAYRNLGP